MPNYIDYRLSTKVSRSFNRIVTGKTDIEVADNGTESRNARWKHKQMRYGASYPLLSREQQEELVSAFYAANAALLLFRFRDFGDNAVLNSPLAVDVGTRNPVQLSKRYTFGPVSVDRKLWAIRRAVVTAVTTGVEISGVVDTVFGTFTPDVDWPADDITWSGSFDIWVRFASDEFDISMIDATTATVDVELIEGRPHR